MKTVRVSSPSSPALARDAFAPDPALDASRARTTSDATRVRSIARCVATPRARRRRAWRVRVLRTSRGVLFARFCTFLHVLCPVLHVLCTFLHVVARRRARSRDRDLGWHHSAPRATETRDRDGVRGRSTEHLVPARTLAEPTRGHGTRRRDATRVGGEHPSRFLRIVRGTSPDGVVLRSGERGEHRAGEV